MIKLKNDLSIKSKLMWSNRRQANFHLKSDLNYLLIDFIDPKSWNQIESSWQNRFNLVRFLLKKLIYIEKRSNLIKHVKIIWKSSRFRPFSIKFHIFLILINHFWWNNLHLGIFFNLLIEIDWKKTKSIDCYQN